MSTTSSSEKAFPNASSTDSVPGRSSSYALSPLQQGMLFQWQLDRHSGTDIEQIVGDLYEPIDAGRLESAWNAAVESLATLRTAFAWEGLATPRQHVQPAAELAFTFEDLRSLPDSGAKARVSEFLDRDRREGFDLAHAPATRVHLFQVADEHFRLVWTVHHILIDGRSFEVVLKAVFNAYDSATQAEDTPPYSEYIEWIERQDLTESRAFWREKLAGFSAPTPIPADLQPDGGAARYEHRLTHLSSAATQQLRELASRENLTLNTLIMSAWGLMLARYSGETDIVFGATKTTRRGTVANADSILGVFLATIPVRLDVDPERSVLQWLQHVREEWVSLRGSEHLPLVDIRQSSDVRTPRLFDTLFVFENFSFGKRLNAEGGAWSARHFGILEQTGFPLTLAGYGDDELALRVEYDASKFSSPMIDVMLGHLTTLLQRWTGDTSVPLWSASMLTDAEERLVVRDWNATTVDYPREAFIHELFAEEATRRPEAIAAQHQGASITYGELNASANLLAARLAREGVSVGDCVGVFADRSIEYIVACVAILKAGAAYLPFEPGYPTDRMLFMIGDANARVVVTPRQFASEFEGYVSDAASPPRVVVIDDPDANVPALDDSPEATAAAVAHGDDAGSRAAYVMYTSGSSGHPKGVAVPHRAVVRLSRNSSVADYRSTDVMLSIATTMFDASTWEMWSVLLNGGRLAVLPAGQIDLGQVSDLVQSAGVTMLLNTAALFQQVVEFGLQPFATVRLFLIGGDVVPVPQLRRAVAALPGCQFVNAYGPTENAVITTAYAVPMGRPIEDPLPIGPPISNTTTYVLNTHGAPSAIGEPGELYTGGDGVAVGYVNRPELTAERFLPDPFSNEPGARMYRTGDAARWRSDGVIEYLGRLDNQVKIRGYRIEPGEVEAAMGELPGVRSAAVAVRKDALGQKRLLGYYVPIEGSALTPAGVRQALRATLPDYMVPVSIMALAELPQTNSGKIDRKALPEPTQDENANIEAGFRSRPLGRSQRQLAKIWEELLGRTSIGVDDDFFEIGGHSLLAVRMMGEVERALGRRLALTSLLERPTIRHLAKLVDVAMLGDPEPAMVVLQPEGTATPFVFVHGDLTGGGWYCRRLSSLIGENVPLIVMPTFRPPANGESWTIETMAEMHVRELRKVRPKGPYHIGGFCAGGLIALEIARLLVAAGETVEHLILIDSMNKNAPVFRWRPIIDRLAPPTPDQRRFVQRQNVLRRISYYDSRLRAVASMGGSELARWAVNTVRIRLPGGRRAEQAASSVPTKDSPSAPEVQAPTRPEREKLLFYARSAAVYVPRRYVGSVDLVFSSDPSDQATNATDPHAAAQALSVGYGPIAKGWQSVLPSARVHHIPGMHISMIVDNIDKLGACLRECLGVIDE